MKRWLTRILPQPRAVLASRPVAMFGKLLHDPNLWHLNRRSVAGAVAVGLFLVFLPMVGQTFIAAAVAIWLRVNLPIAVALTWLSNPLTAPPMYWFALVVGRALLGRPLPPFEPAFWLDWHNWPGVYGEIALGSLVCGTVCAAAGYFGVQALWRHQLRQRIARRRGAMNRGARD